MDELTATLAALPIPALAINAARRIATMNAAAIVLLGGELTGRHFATVLRQPGVIDAVEGVLGGAPAAEAGFASHDNGVETKWRAFVATGSPGKGVAILSLMDETSQADADAMRRDFVANVSHELKTPLTALLGFIETLQGPARDDPEARDRFLAIMAREAGRMDRLTQDLLSLSRVEREVRRRPETMIDLTGIARAAVAALEPVAAASDVSLKFSTESGLPEIRGDSDQLAQVLSNLIENGVKYGREKGRVSITLTRREKDARLTGPVQRIDVTDQGAGIEAHHIARLTERFYRIDSHRSRAIGGTGLGLAIAKHILQRHRGRLEITSKPGHGSTFSVVLPED